MDTIFVAIENEVTSSCKDYCHAALCRINDRGKAECFGGRSKGVAFSPKWLHEAITAHDGSQAHSCEDVPGLSVTVGSRMALADRDVDGQDWMGNPEYNLNMDKNGYSSRMDQIHDAMIAAAPEHCWYANILAHAVLRVPDFPKPGILFQDLSPILASPLWFKLLSECAVKSMERIGSVNKVVGLDARGFIYGPILAAAVGAGFVMARKAGKLPHAPDETLHTVEYGTEYSKARLQLLPGCIAPGDRVVLCDDLVATGGSLVAAKQLVERAGGIVQGCIVMLAVAPLLAQAQEALAGTPLIVVIPSCNK